MSKRALSRPQPNKYYPEPHEDYRGWTAQIDVEANKCEKTTEKCFKVYKIVGKRWVGKTRLYLLIWLPTNGQEFAFEWVSAENIYTNKKINDFETAVHHLFCSFIEEESIAEEDSKLFWNIVGGQLEEAGGRFYTQRHVALLMVAKPKKRNSAYKEEPIEVFACPDDIVDIIAKELLKYNLLKPEESSNPATQDLFANAVKTPLAEYCQELYSEQKELQYVIRFYKDTTPQIKKINFCDYRQRQGNVKPVAFTYSFNIKCPLYLENWANQQANPEQEEDNHEKGQDEEVINEKDEKKEMLAINDQDDSDHAYQEAHNDQNDSDQCDKDLDYINRLDNLKPNQNNQTKSHCSTITIESQPNTDEDALISNDDDNNNCLTKSVDNTQENIQSAATVSPSETVSSGYESCCQSPNDLEDSTEHSYQNVNVNKEKIIKKMLPEQLPEIFETEDSFLGNSALKTNERLQTALITEESPVIPMMSPIMNASNANAETLEMCAHQDTRQVSDFNEQNGQLQVIKRKHHDEIDHLLSPNHPLATVKCFRNGNQTWAAPQRSIVNSQNYSVEQPSESLKAFSTNEYFGTRIGSNATITCQSEKVQNYPQSSAVSRSTHYQHQPDTPLLAPANDTIPNVIPQFLSIEPDIGLLLSKLTYPVSESQDTLSHTNPPQRSMPKTQTPMLSFSTLQPIAPPLSISNTLVHSNSQSQLPMCTTAPYQFIPPVNPQSQFEFPKPLQHSTVRKHQKTHVSTPKRLSSSNMLFNDSHIRASFQQNSKLSLFQSSVSNQSKATNQRLLQPPQQRRTFPNKSINHFAFPPNVPSNLNESWRQQNISTPKATTYLSPMSASTHFAIPENTATYPNSQPTYPYSQPTNPYSQPTNPYSQPSYPTRLPFQSANVTLQQISPISPMTLSQRSSHINSSNICNSNISHLSRSYCQFGGSTTAYQSSLSKPPSQSLDNFSDDFPFDELEDFIEQTQMQQPKGLISIFPN